MYHLAKVLSLGALVLLVGCDASLAQSWPPWADDIFGRRFEHDSRRYERERPLAPPQRYEPRASGGDIRDGGARPEIQPTAPPIVAFDYGFPANSIVIETSARKLFYVLEGHRAYQYPISVGREGFNWTGTELVSRKQAWPDWHPPAEMRERDPRLPEKMTGGLKNPLGAMALYLGHTLYRIHGTNDVKSIGQAQSSGCFRMLNSAVLHLASITEIGTSVAVVRSLPQRQELSRAPEFDGVTRNQSEVRGQPPPAVIGEPRDYRSLRDYTFGR